ncbi:MAG: efflux RND transporter periplasmic adaptor subunit [Bacteroidales bacterium]
MNLTRKFGTLSLAFLVVMSTLTTACSKSKKTDKTTVATEEMVEVLILKKEMIDKVMEYTATLKPWEEVHLAPASPARIERILADVSDEVHQGQSLVEMDKTQLLQTELQLKNLESEFRRAEILFKAGSYSAQAYDQLKTQYEVAQENAKFLKRNVVLKAPFPGVISGKYFENGEMYSGSPVQSIGKAAILSLVQINVLKAVIAVPESYFPILKKGMKAEVLSDTYSDKTFVGTIDIIYPTIDAATRSFEVEFKVQNPNNILRPGMFVRLSLNMGRAEAMVVPDYTVLKMQGTNERYVFIDDNGTAKRVVVTLGARFNDKVEILSDELKMGDRVVTEGQGRLVDGVKIKIANN